MRTLQVIPWRMTNATYKSYLAWGSIAGDNAPGTEAHEAAVEELKMLPGFPGGEGDGVQFQPVIIDEVSSLRVH